MPRLYRLSHLLRLPVLDGIKFRAGEWIKDYLTLFVLGQGISQQIDLKVRFFKSASNAGIR